MSAAGAPAGEDLAARLGALVRDVPDFPKPGIVFKDIGPLLADGAALRDATDALVERHRGRFDVVAGIEARGFILGAAVAYAAGAGFVPVRKEGKLPAATHSAAYDLEYGQAVLELHTDAVARGARVLVVDDVLATGGTAAATVGLVERAGGNVVGVSVLLELAFLAGRDRLPGRDVHALLTV